MKNNMNIEPLGKINEKLKLYVRDEELEFSDIRRTLNDINYNYDTDNTIKLEEIEERLKNLDKSGIWKCVWKE